MGRLRLRLKSSPLFRRENNELVNYAGNAFISFLIVVKFAQEFLVANGIKSAQGILSFFVICAPREAPNTNEVANYGFKSSAETKHRRRIDGVRSSTVTKKAKTTN